MAEIKKRGYSTFFISVRSSMVQANNFIRSQNTPPKIEYLGGDECESEYILPRAWCVLHAHVNLKNNTEAFQAAEVYEKIGLKKVKSTKFLGDTINFWQGSC